MRFTYISQNLLMQEKAQANQWIHTIWPETLLIRYTKGGSEKWSRPKVGNIVPSPHLGIIVQSKKGENYQELIQSGT